MPGILFIQPPQMIHDHAEEKVYDALDHYP